MKYVIATWIVNGKEYLKFWYLLENDGVNWYKSDVLNKNIKIQVREYPNFKVAKEGIYKSFYFL